MYIGIDGRGNERGMANAAAVAQISLVVASSSFLLTNL
jgi:hypothetical protein